MSAKSYIGTSSDEEDWLDNEGDFFEGKVVVNSPFGKRVLSLEKEDLHTISDVKRALGIPTLAGEFGILSDDTTLSSLQTKDSTIILFSPFSVRPLVQVYFWDCGTSRSFVIEQEDVENKICPHLGREFPFRLIHHSLSFLEVRELFSIPLQFRWSYQNLETEETKLFKMKDVLKIDVLESFSECYSIVLGRVKSNLKSHPYLQGANNLKIDISDFTLGWEKSGTQLLLPHDNRPIATLLKDSPDFQSMERQIFGSGTVVSPPPPLVTTPKEAKEILSDPDLVLNMYDFPCFVLYFRLGEGASEGEIKQQVKKFQIDLERRLGDFQVLQSFCQPYDDIVSFLVGSWQLEQHEGITEKKICELLFQSLEGFDNLVSVIPRRPQAPLLDQLPEDLRLLFDVGALDSGQVSNALQSIQTTKNWMVEMKKLRQKGEKREHMTNEEAKLFHHMRHLTNDEMSAIYLYTCPGFYGPLNSWFRDTTSDDSGKRQTARKALGILKYYNVVLTHALSALSKSTEKFGCVYRGISEQRARLYAKAKQLVMRSYTSTSWSEEVARNWSSWVLEIHIPPNLDSPGGAAVELFSHFPNESEVLLPPMAFLEITKVDDESKTIIATFSALFTSRLQEESKEEWNLFLKSLRSSETEKEALELLHQNHWWDFNHPNRKGHTPLYLASRNGLPSLIQPLLRLGARSETVQRTLSTPIHAAAYFQRLKCLEELDSFLPRPVMVALLEQKNEFGLTAYEEGVSEAGENEQGNHIVALLDKIKGSPDLADEKVKLWFSLLKLSWASTNSS